MVNGIICLEFAFGYTVTTARVNGLSFVKRFQYLRRVSFSQTESFCRKITHIVCFERETNFDN